MQVELLSFYNTLHVHNTKVYTPAQRSKTHMSTASNAFAGHANFVFGDYHGSDD